jgi:Ni,Fe-hydrogenase I cytochrome b subunit
LTEPRSGRFILWCTAYLLLSAFVLPTSMLTRLTGIDVWALYIKGAWFLWGELLLVALLLHEYWGLQNDRRARLQPGRLTRLQG